MNPYGLNVRNSKKSNSGIPGSTTFSPAVHQGGVIAMIGFGLIAIAASIMFGPKANTAIVVLKAAQSTQIITKPAQKVQDFSAGVPEDQLPVFESRASDSVTPRKREQATEASELGVNLPAARISVTRKLEAVITKNSNNTNSQIVSREIPKTFLRHTTSGVRVQVIALSTIEAAAQIAQNLSSKGFFVSVQPSGQLFRVVIGPYPTDVIAQAAAKRASAYVQ